MAEIRFASREHESFFHEMMKKCGHYDSYHKAFFYCMGISDTARTNVGRRFDFKTDCIKPDGLHEGWQTGGTVRLTRLALNLWNGYVEQGEDGKDPYGGNFLPHIRPDFKGTERKRNLSEPL